MPGHILKDGHVPHLPSPAPPIVVPNVTRWPNLAPADAETDRHKGENHSDRLHRERAGEGAAKQDADQQASNVATDVC